jgi:hypothetical protein
VPWVVDQRSHLLHQCQGLPSKVFDWGEPGRGASFFQLEEPLLGGAL